MLEVKTIQQPRTLLQWYEERDSIDMNPSYQRRGDLWPERNKKLLINSILNRYDIPKIYLADFTYGSTSLNENRKPYAVIDGKQRLNIFFAFFNDKLTLDEKPIHQNSSELVLKGLSYSDLSAEHPVLARRVEEFVPAVMSVISDELEEVQELFIRLNLNVSISGPERRNAMRGPIPNLTRDLSVHEFFRSYATFPINRGQDLNAAAKMLLMEKRGGFTNTKKQDLDRFVQLNVDKEASEFQAAHDNATATLEAMTETFHQQDKLLAGQAQLPIYYEFAKRHAGRYADTIRHFLTTFEDERKAARAEVNAKGMENIGALSSTLVEYNGLLRSPDDRTKQERMFNILNERFKRFLQDVRRDAETK